MGETSRGARFSRLDPERLQAALERSHGLVPAVTHRMQRRALTGEILQRASGPPAGEARHSAVLALLYPHAGSLTLALTHRANHLVQHSGQVSLPGGGREPTDESLWHTAVRETHEELGVRIDASTPAAELERIYVLPSNYYVTGFVAWSPVRPAFAPSPAEVAALIEASLDELRQPQAFIVAERDYQDQRVLEGYFQLRGHRIWGATALLLDQLLERLERGLADEGD